ncbi:amidohydrolase family protein [Leptobacterium flavescens]|uniref:Amidohydrolase family protein n=1 Tax=Leptobacterium flavescens TaxID=472055 RepID=A0A6P0UNY7_9FLAO|nr:amidohydrolase family protein [Leptobacterium flavescens]NER14150.1 amidohydrolase family protein [Leptobacterium flavescens]
MKKILLVLAMFWCSISVFAQEYFPKNDGVKTTNNNFTAFTNARLFVTPTQVIDNGTLLIQNGKVVASGASVKIPENSVVIDLGGKYIYPSFIDIYSTFGVEKPKRRPGGGRSAQYNPSREGFYWNDHIMPENKAMSKFKFSNQKAKDLVKSGFGVVNTHIEDGIIRGTSVLVALNADGDNSERILDQDAAQHLSFSKSVTSNQSYPTSIMGAMALLRQLYHDAKWYKDGNSSTKDLSIEALLANQSLPQIFDAGDKMQAFRAAKIANEFGLNYIIKGGGNEFERIDDIKNTNASYIVPLDFPIAYDVTDPYNASKVSLADMRLWNQAPTNPGLMAKNGIRFALTTAGLKKASDFKTNLMKALEYGLDKTKALEALTTTPASLLGKSDQLGSLKNGSYANFLITSGDIFDKNTTLYENWVQGHKNIVNDMNIKDIRGEYDLTIAGKKYLLKIKGKFSAPSSELTLNSAKIGSKMTYKNGWVNIFYNPTSEKTEFVRLTAAVTASDNLSGKGTLTNGNAISWTAVKQAGKEDANGKKDNGNAKTYETVPVTFPNKAYGVKELPKQQTILFKNATVWTNEAEGILKNADVLVKDGKIVKVGSNLSQSGATVIDATGKHLTSGIIDEHSHIAAASVNEAGHNSSAEVTMEDVVNPEDINLYRNLSGGVTSMQILHGSANPIGGRSALIKLKWGENADEMIIDNSPGFIKFALGENVKQSNWQSFNRFPQSRMGVEQVFVDYFQRAKEYDEKWKNYNKLSAKARARTKAPRYDIEMHTIAEILNKERFISCHSYVQSEINMLMKVVEKFNFNVNTFTHILEGYKVADKMAAHGVGGSTFSDWWSYKNEVNDAIPYNAAIMHNAGVVVAINSDDREMSRRLNQEAAKSVKYGGVSEEDAWKFITLNPAKLLHLDDRMGSIKAGKDADLVLWSDHPLSIYAIAEKTMIDGAVYYDYKQMQQIQEDIRNEKNKLINMMIKEKNKGVKTQQPKKKVDKELHCNSL